jgi:O-antigen/teichoic acid export membrane protein
MLIDFATIIFGARVAQAVFRFYCTAKNEDDRKSIIASALFLGIVLNGLGSIVIAVLSEPIAVAMFADASFSDYIALFAVTMFLIPLNQIPMTHIRARQKPWLFLIFSICRLFLQLILNIYFVVYLELHVAGVIYSAVISSIIMSIPLTSYSVLNAGIRFRRSDCKRLFTFSLPLKLASISTFYLTFGDRYFINHFFDLSQVGIYALGYKFGFIFTLIAWTPFEKMWDAEKYTILEKPNAREIYKKTFLYTSTFLIFIGLCISLYSKDLLKIMADPAFLEAHKIVPIIIIAYVFQAWAKFCNFGILLEKKTMHIAYSEMIAAFFITFAYFALIPEFGIFGAAWATVVGFLTRFYWANKKGMQYYDMALPWMKVSLTAGLAIIIFLLSLMSSENIIESLLFRTLLITSFIFIFYVSPILSVSEKAELSLKFCDITRSIKSSLFLR